MCYSSDDKRSKFKPTLLVSINRHFGKTNPAVMEHTIFKLHSFENYAETVNSKLKRNLLSKSTCIVYIYYIIYRLFI